MKFIAKNVPILIFGMVLNRPQEVVFFLLRFALVLKCLSEAFNLKAVFLSGKPRK